MRVVERKEVLGEAFEVASKLSVTTNCFFGKKTVEYLASHTKDD